MPRQHRQHRLERGEGVLVDGGGRGLDRRRARVHGVYLTVALQGASGELPVEVIGVVLQEPECLPRRGVAAGSPADEVAEALFWILFWEEGVC